MLLLLLCAPPPGERKRRPKNTAHTCVVVPARRGSDYVWSGLARTWENAYNILYTYI